ncbi:MAG: ferrous iron transport protein A [Firmicutes bacterium]|nr:ferrous iron transport protein A [Bacillota bacterium]HAL63633.1 ferrous iron transport protein A [Clostridiales bacterium]
MIPISFADIGKECVIKKIGGSPEVKKHLENLGFTIGGNATVISTLGGNVIVKVKESRVAIDSGMANKILI